MTDADLSNLADRLGLHCDLDDDPIEGETPTLYLWHDRDVQVDGGLLIARADDSFYVADLKAWGLVTPTPPVDGLSQSGLETIEDVIHFYASRWLDASGDVDTDVPKLAALPRIAKPIQPERMPGRRKRHDWRIQSQKKIGAFKAFDALGHIYRIEIFREIFPGEPPGPLKLVTTEGEIIRRIDKGRYRIDHESILLTSDDPSAP